MTQSSPTPDDVRELIEAARLFNSIDDAALFIIAAARSGWPADRERADRAEARVRELEAALDGVVTGYKMEAANPPEWLDCARTALENRT